VVPVLALAGLIHSGPAYYETARDMRRQLVSDSRAIELLDVQAGKWINAHAQADATVGVHDAGAIRYFGERRTIDLVGLNNADVAFARTSVAATYGQCEWLVVFMSWYSDHLMEHSDRLLAYIGSRFDVREIIRIPPEEYTVSPYKGQASVTILQRRRGG